MGSWSVITCVRARADALTPALTALFARDGYRPGPPLSGDPPREWDFTDFTQFTRAASWRVQLWDGPAWTQVHCTPIYLMSGRAAGSARPRLADLAAALSADAFALNVYDSTDAVLLECAAEGPFALTGTTYNLADDIFQQYPDFDPPGGIEALSFPYFEETLSGRDPQPQFRLIRDLLHFNPSLAGDVEPAVGDLSQALSGADELTLKLQTPPDADLSFRRA